MGDDLMDIISYNKAVEAMEKAQEAYDQARSVVDDLENHIKPHWEVLPLKNGAEKYSEAQTPQYCKIGNIIYIKGSIVGVNEDNVTVATLPEGYRNRHDFLQLASGNNPPNVTRWLIDENSGDIIIQSTSRDHSTSNWFPLDTSFVLE